MVFYRIKKVLIKFESQTKVSTQSRIISSLEYTQIILMIIKRKLLLTLMLFLMIFYFCNDMISIMNSIIKESHWSFQISALFCHIHRYFLFAQTGENVTLLIDIIQRKLEMRGKSKQ